MGMIGLGNLKVVKPIGELGTEEAKTGRGFFDFGDQRRTTGRSGRIEGHAKAQWPWLVLNLRLQFGEVSPAPLVPEFRFFMFQNPRENHDASALIRKRDETSQSLSRGTGVDGLACQEKSIVNIGRLTSCHKGRSSIQTDDVPLRSFPPLENITRNRGILLRCPSS